MCGLADHHEVLGVLRIVLVQGAPRQEGVDDPIAEHVTQLVFVHPAMEAERGDDVNVVDAGLGGEIEDRLDNALAVVGAFHLGQREAGVVEADRELHIGPQQCGKRLHVDRIQQRVADGPVQVREAVERFGRVDDPAAIDGEALEAEALAAPEQGRWCRAVDVEHEAGDVACQETSRRSKAIFTAPRRPAAVAWAIASTWSSMR